MISTTEAERKLFRSDTTAEQGEATAPLPPTPPPLPSGPHVWPADTSIGTARPAYTPCSPPAQADTTPPAGTCPFVVPDYVLMDSDLARPGKPQAHTDIKGRKNKRPLLSTSWLADILRYQVWMQRRMPVVLPDLLLRRLIWGPEQRQDWRRTLGMALGRIKVAVKWSGECDTGCPLHGSGLRHCHTTIALPEEALGRIAGFIRHHADGRCEFNFDNRMSSEDVVDRRAYIDERMRELATDTPEYLDFKAQHKRLKIGGKKVTGVRPVYLPIRLFGPSPKSGLTPLGVNVMATITMELTRVRGQSCRPDRAQAVDRDHRLGCRLLEQKRTYVLFGGNGRPGKDYMHGRGYRLGTWMARSAMPKQGDDNGDADTKLYMTLLASLSAKFGLVVVAYHSRQREWRSLGEMVSMTRNGVGRQWLRGCLMRVYTESDYLPRWRAYFASRLGFATIPDGSETQVDEPGLRITSAEQLRQWMAMYSVNDAQLAQAMEVSRATIVRYRIGSRAWSRRFESKLDKYLASGSACNLY